MENNKLVTGLSRFFWGSLLISLGGGLFIFRIIPFPMHSFSISLFLASVLILLGTSFFTSSSIIKKIIVASVGVLLAFLILNVFFHTKFKIETYSDNYDKTYNTNRDTMLSFNDVKADTAAVNFHISSGNLEITDINTTHLKLNHLGFDAFKIDYDSLSKAYNLTSEIYLQDNDRKEVAKVQLNDQVVWNLKGRLNAADFWANFSNINLAKLYVNANSSDLDLEFGEKSPNIEVQILSHNSEIDLVIPYKAYCEISSNVPIDHYTVDELKEESPGFYTCGDPKHATTKMKVTITGDIKEFKLSRVK